MILESKVTQKPSPLDPQFRDILSQIKLVAFDVDGVLTDGTVEYIEGQGFTRRFTIKDGYGIKLLLENQIQVAVISGGESLDLKKRIEWLKIPHAILGSEDKLRNLQKLGAELSIPFHQIAYIGDDLFDIPALKIAGFSATVPGAQTLVKNTVHAITRNPGGFGAGRELCDAVLIAHGKMDPYSLD
jgi:3-deoxy-D-manno-octulosonate 8-phosphate phosphatase (KDO 8-P phosphatase)